MRKKSRKRNVVLQISQKLQTEHLEDRLLLAADALGVVRDDGLLTSQWYLTTDEHESTAVLEPDEVFYLDLANGSVPIAAGQSRGVGAILNGDKLLVIDGDFDDDGDFDCDDIDALVFEIAAGANNPLFDLTGDGDVTVSDRDAWLMDAGDANLGLGHPYLLGDANLDGFVDGQDFLAWNANKFTTLASWCSGDFTADGIIDGQDFSLWNSNKFQSSGTGFVPPPILASPTNRVQDVRVLVLNYEPTVPSQNDQTLWEIFNWNDPRDLAVGYIKDMEFVSGGAIDFQIVDWRDLNEFPVFENGYQYGPDEYVQNRATGTGWVNSAADFDLVAEQQGLADLINDDMIDEIWVFGDHFFNLFGAGGLSEGWMAGPDSFFINGPSFPQLDVDRAVAGHSFSYERGVAEMIHNLGHRTENQMSRTYGGWNSQDPSTPWDLFASNAGQSNTSTFGVGNTHFPFNGAVDFDYSNLSTYASYSDDFVYNFPDQTYATQVLGRDAWGDRGTGDWQRGYLNWFFGHVPRADLMAPDGRANNWFKYIYDFNAYEPTTGAARDNDVIVGAPNTSAEGQAFIEFTARYYDREGIDVSSLGDGDLRITGPGGYDQLAFVDAVFSEKATTAGTARTVRYRIPGPDGDWSNDDVGTYSISLENGQVFDLAGTSLPGGFERSFNLIPSTSGQVDVNGLLLAGEATVTVSAWDKGSPELIFDNDPVSLLRTASVNPAIVTLEFDNPQTISAFSARLSHASGAPAYEWKVEAADNTSDLNAQNGSYRLLVPITGALSDQDSVFDLLVPVTANVFRLTVTRLTGDDFVHINEWTLFEEPLGSSIDLQASVRVGRSTSDLVFGFHHCLFDVLELPAVLRRLRFLSLGTPN